VAGIINDTTNKENVVASVHEFDAKQTRGILAKHQLNFENDAVCLGLHDLSTMTCYSFLDLTHQLCLSVIIEDELESAKLRTAEFTDAHDVSVIVEIGRKLKVLHSFTICSLKPV